MNDSSLLNNNKYQSFIDAQRVVDLTISSWLVWQVQGTLPLISIVNHNITSGILCLNQTWYQANWDNKHVNETVNNIDKVT